MFILVCDKAPYSQLFVLYGNHFNISFSICSHEKAIGNTEGIQVNCCSTLRELLYPLLPPVGHVLHLKVCDKKKQRISTVVKLGEEFNCNFVEASHSCHENFMKNIYFWTKMSAKRY